VRCGVQRGSYRKSFRVGAPLTSKLKRWPQTSAQSPSVVLEDSAPKCREELGGAASGAGNGSQAGPSPGPHGGLLW